MLHMVLLDYAWMNLSVMVAVVLEESILFLVPVLKASRMVMEACSWQDCMFSASKVSQANGCFRLLKIYSCIPVRENVEWVLSLLWFSGICFPGYWGSWC